MTKLMQWLIFGIVYLSIWVDLVSKKIQFFVFNGSLDLVLYLPVITVVVFGVYFILVILWRVYTFNDCEEAAAELKRQINEAKADLKVKGFQFKEGAVR